MSMLNNAIPMSMFNNANNILISGSVFNTVRRDYVHHSGETKGQQFYRWSDCDESYPHTQRLKFFTRKLHLEHSMMAQDIQSVTLVLVRESSLGLKSGSTILILCLNSYGFTVQPVLERLRSPQALQKFTPSREGWQASFLIDMHLAVMTNRSLSRRWCISLPSAVQSFGDVLLRSLRETK